MSERTTIARIIIVVLLLLSIGPSAIAQNPKVDSVKSDKQAVAPSEPEKDINRKIWEGYYTAELNYRYHLKQASDVSSDGWRVGFVALVSLLVAWALPYFTLIWHFSMAVIGKTQQERLEKVAEASRGRSFWTVSMISLVALIIGVVAGTMGNSERSGRHKVIASEWSELAQQWNDLRDEREKIPNDKLIAKYQELLTKQNAITRMETADLYDEVALRRAQHELNAFLHTDNS